MNEPRITLEYDGKAWHTMPWRWVLLDEHGQFISSSYGHTRRGAIWAARRAWRSHQRQQRRKRHASQETVSIESPTRRWLTRKGEQIRRACGRDSYHRRKR